MGYDPEVLLQKDNFSSFINRTYHIKEVLYLIAFYQIQIFSNPLLTLIRVGFKHWQVNQVRYF